MAKASGVSPTTASLVLTGRGRDLRISHAAEHRVRSAAEELGYRRDVGSGGTRKNRTRTIGLISDSIASSQLAGDMVTGAVEAAGGRGFMLFTGESGGDPDVERSLVEAMRDHRVDGIVLASMCTRRVLVPEGLGDGPAVLLNALPVRPSTLSSVLPDEVQAGRSAARVLVDAGHREGIHLIGAGPGPGQVPPNSIAAVERLAGVREVLDAAGIAVAGRSCSDWTPENGYDATRELLRRTTPTALLCFNDRLAFGAYQALADAALSVPEDVSVMSFDDHPIASWLRPRLSTVVLPHHQLGAKAVEVLFAVAERRGRPPGVAAVHRVPMPVHHGGSVRSFPVPRARGDARVEHVHNLAAVDPPIRSS
ncbi:LacI family DNA-binding transcriptional regulator [Umezawaea sp. Da 62-37]|uniref:LacI family DNA-binding transcriptional regulator n=1 Tax=Umezawaea sp. Da 62-37 TaxID=3075927 RepID=UPI0028F70A2F|nr:LacI family DNA-binding transcriptional regulator [Umezawaea sp. Da 62-37]WNV87353.1 LacI family DNA-binding transcriptional regulator [Umezawaea sp. Da 62-37]